MVGTRRGHEVGDTDGREEDPETTVKVWPLLPVSPEYFKLRRGILLVLPFFFLFFFFFFFDSQRLFMGVFGVWVES